MFYVVGDSHKLGIINRFHRTLKEKILKYFISSGTTRWIDVINKIIQNYNNTETRTIKCTPTEASNHFIQSMIIFNAKDKTELIEDKDTPSVPSHKRFSVFRAFSGAVFLAIEQPNQKTARTCLNQFFF